MEKFCVVGYHPERSGQHLFIIIIIWGRLHVKKIQGGDSGRSGFQRIGRKIQEARICPCCDFPGSGPHMGKGGHPLWFEIIVISCHPVMKFRHFWTLRRNNPGGKAVKCRKIRELHTDWSAVLDTEIAILQACPESITLKRTSLGGPLS